MILVLKISLDFDLQVTTWTKLVISPLVIIFIYSKKIIIVQKI